MSPLRRLLLAAAAALALPAARAQTPSPAAPLRLGLAPYLSPAALLTAFRPLREHLERVLAQPVELLTARDFLALVAAVRAQDYDLALLPAHMARVAVADWSWQPLARTSINAEVLVLVRSDGPVRTLADLQGRRVGMLDVHSLSAAVGVQWLRAQQLADVEVAALPSVNSAMHALAIDEVAAVVAAATQLLALPPGTPTNHRPLARLSDIPGPWIVARPAVPADRLGRWREALHGFEPDARRPTTAANSRLAPLTVADTERVEPHAAYLRRQLAMPR